MKRPIAPPGSSRTLLYAATVVLTLLVAFVPLRVAAFANDGLTVMEGSWRLQQGMRIHTDWHSPIGPFYYFILNLGIDIAGITLRAFPVASAIMLPCVVAVSYFMFGRRFGSTQTLVLVAVQAATIVGVCCLGMPDFKHSAEIRATTFGMQYNRFLWPPSMVAVLGLLLPVREDRKGGRLETVDALLIGACFAILFFGKINYFIAAIPIIAYGVWRRGGRWSLGMAAGALLVAATFVLLRVSLRDYVQDLRDLAVAQGLFQRIASIAERVGDNFEVLIFLAIGFVYAVRVTRHAPEAKPYLTAAPVLAAYGIVVASTNFQDTDIPAMGMAAVMLLEAVRVGRASERTGETATSPPGWAAFAYGVAGAFVLVNVASLAFAYLCVVRTPARVNASYVPVFRGMIELPGSDTDKLYRMTQEEAELVDRYLKPDEPVSSMTWFNVLPVASGRRSPRGLLWYHEGKTVTRKTMPPAAREFATTAGVVFKRLADKMSPLDQIVVDTYGSYVRSNFVEVAQSPHWTLWLRPDLVKRQSTGLRSPSPTPVSADLDGGSAGDRSQPSEELRRGSVE